ncbi:hypothetical protein Acsp03_71630 [Actinomadura sp. NBRC 104412]|uniref:helix-turn-helix domain-containing protein n=1 Tax=Actinomadura sp. NBRC 104412 TaxID=3032203 RepID=UPI0024A56D35|nr:helix-turn-helix transcriptional regulator [Actinomadura sp. NBRC 104412]GLZ09697.1 hypothetical protein Acsp03_71630 [Actinomadura sp. NBRC 104412]
MDPQARDNIAAELRATGTAAGWSPWQLVQAIHDKAQTPTLLMAWRLATGQTQDEVVTGVQGLAADDGRPCAISVQSLSKYENGHHAPGPFYKRYLALWFRCRLDRLGLADEDPVDTLVGEVPALPQPQEDDVERRNFLGLAAAAPLVVSLDSTRSRMDEGLRRVLPAQDLQHWWDATADHVAAYGTMPPTGLLKRLAPDLDSIAALAERYPHQRDLHLIASRLCGLTGALHTDLQQDRVARDWLHTANRYAELSGNTAQQYWVAMAQAMALMYAPTPQPHRVVTIAERARNALGNASSASAAQLTGLAARAHAQLGRHAQAHTELHKARSIFDGLGDAQINEPFFGFPTQEMTMYSSQVLSRTGASTAWDEQNRALAGYALDDPMDRPLILLDRARYVTGKGDADHAARIASDAIGAVPQQLRVPLLLTQVEDVASLIAQRSPQAANQLRQSVHA